MNQGALGVYVHFPWCVKKCPYCDFNSHPLRGELPSAEYLDAVLTDLESYTSMLASRSILSVFFGGGTPSLFAPEVFSTLLRALDSPAVETTMEINPGTAEFHSLPGYLDAGINRLSFGAQSFDNNRLLALGRIHRAEETIRAVQLARAAGFKNINLDIMYGLPGQSADEAIADLRTALSLEPEHLSWYELTLEPKTEFYRRPPTLPSEETMLEIEDSGRTLLQQHGFERYEVSAWAKPGYRCQHNLNYWRYGDYVGLGAGAHGKLTDGNTILRTRKAAQPRLYLAAPGKTETVPVDPNARSGEFLLNVLRLRDGVPWEAFERGTGLDPSTLEATWEDGVTAGLLQKHRIATTDLGFRFLDTVLQSFL